MARSEKKNVTLKDRLRLISGDLMPYIGFGTSRIVGDDNILETFDYAFQAGYRLLDSAQGYGNEKSIGKALNVLLPKYNLTRRDIFVTSKLLPEYLGANDVYDRIETSVKNLDCQYIDLFFIHFPGLKGRDENPNPKNDSVLRDETWQVFIRAVKNGLVRNIGVSNYNVNHLKELIINDHGIKPAVNQVEWHPSYHQPELLEFCKKEGVLLQAYRSLGGVEGKGHLLNKPEVIKVSEKLEKTPSQVLLRWATQQRIGIIPKSASKQRIIENSQLDFIIPEEDMQILSNLEQIKFAWDPSSIQ